MVPTFPVSLLTLNDKGVNEPQLREATSLLHGEGIDIHVRIIWEKGGAVWFIDEALQLNVETVIVDGGGGTIGEVATALVKRGSRMALGVLPLGTVDDFAISVGIPQDPASALELMIVGRDVPIDIARVSDKAGFINVAIGGFGTRITIETPKKLETTFGGISYLIHNLMRMNTLRPGRCEIRRESFHWQGDMLVIGIDNGHQTDGGRQSCPETLINDSLLHLCILTGEKLIPTLFNTLVNSENSPNIVDGVSSWFKITAPYEMTFSLDGGPLSGKTFRMELLSTALRCRLPPDCPLLRWSGFVKQRRRPAGVQQPGSLIEPLNVKVRRHLRSQEKPGQNINPNTALTLIDDIYNLRLT